jgi:hypothetical protein
LPKLRQIRSLLEKFVPDQKNDRLVLNTVHIKNRVVGSKGDPTTHLQVGGAYGHSIEFVRNYAVWPVTVQSETNIVEAGQLAYRTDPKKWGFKVELLPNHGVGPTTEVLYCRARLSGKDELVTTFTCNSTHTDTMTVGLSIE